MSRGLGDVYKRQFDRRRIEKLKKMIDTGVPIRNWGIVTKNGKTYYIRYTCLERGKVILK